MNDMELAKIYNEIMHLSYHSIHDLYIRCSCECICIVPFEIIENIVKLAENTNFLLESKEVEDCLKWALSNGRADIGKLLISYGANYKELVKSARFLGIYWAESMRFDFYFMGKEIDFDILEKREEERCDILKLYIQNGADFKHLFFAHVDIAKNILTKNYFKFEETFLTVENSMYEKNLYLRYLH
ncbi:hypothetical protein [Campylobacter taeniopygiae]|uniref:hypothetical protein n=1 Tax=Campylobacter taeniopygiae TaxID=2510188 RepID=UPI0014857076|nr:hypothetical protein [Campylobacter taeniopygiae]